jgi:inhibitor of KinA
MRLEPLGDRAVLVRLGDRVEEGTHRRVRALCDRLEAARVPGVVDVVPAFASVALHLDPAALRPDGSPVPAALAAALEAALEEPLVSPEPPSRVVELPVRYGGEAGPDLEEVARRAGLSPEEAVALHAGAEYRVHALGFLPGFPYLGGLPERLATPRRATPRERVPAGSVAIGGSQAGVYPFASPGGWNVIGHTPLRLFRPEADPPALLRVGDRVRFVPVSGEVAR